MSCLTDRSYGSAEHQLMAGCHTGLSELNLISNQDHSVRLFVEALNVSEG